MAQTFIVIKRMINDYEVRVEADTPAEAITKAYENQHDPGELTSEFEDGDTFYPSEWKVLPDTHEMGVDDAIELNRSALKVLD